MADAPAPPPEKTDDEAPPPGGEASAPPAEGTSAEIMAEQFKNLAGDCDYQWHNFDSRVATPKTIIEGPDAQVLTVMLENGEAIFTQPGAMMHMNNGNEQDLHCAPNCCTRCCCLEESCWMASYTNKSGGPGYVALTPNFPAKVITYPMSDGELILKKRGFMSQLVPLEGGVNVDMDTDWGCIRCCCGSLGWCRQRLSCTGTAFINAGGTVLTKELAAGETVMVDHASIVGYQTSVTYDMKMIGNCMMCCAGGEGCFVAELTGPGRVYMQSMSFEKLVNSVSPQGGKALGAVCCLLALCASGEGKKE